MLGWENLKEMRYISNNMLLNVVGKPISHELFTDMSFNMKVNVYVTQSAGAVPSVELYPHLTCRSASTRQKDAQSQRRITCNIVV